MKTCAVRELENASENVFWFRKRQPNSNAPLTLFFIWKKVTVTARVTHVCRLSLLMRSHIVTGHPKRKTVFGLNLNENSMFGKHKIRKLDLYLAPPQIEISLKYNLTQKFPERTLKCGCQCLGTLSDGFTDLSWFGKAGKGRVQKALPPLFMQHSYLPQWRRLVEQGKGR